MNQKIELLISFDSSDSIALMKTISTTIEPFNQNLPNVVTDGFDEYKDTQDWVDKLLPKYKFSATAYWGDIFDNRGFIDYDLEKKIVKIKISDYELTDAHSVIEMLAPLPWTVASIFDFHGDDDNWDEYIAPGFAAFHFQHGWACAFKGKGHNHLVSRRWLEYNPWHLIRDEEHDISFVQFHDLDADPATALEQAKEGHRAMSMYGVGGYIGKTHPFSNDLRGLYVPENRNLRVVISQDKEITDSEMSDYCAARHFQAFEGNPIDKISFVFIVAAKAQPYLHDLWLRDIEVFGFTEKGVEIRLDEDYQPVYEFPEWVKRLQQQETQTQVEETRLELARVERVIDNLNNRIHSFSVPGAAYNEENAKRVKQLRAELKKQNTLKSKLERKITELENN